jgi:hypothetical protein
MVEDNIAAQFEELEAIGAIYECEWQIVDQESRSFRIAISDTERRVESVVLEITLPPEYPSLLPPFYKFDAPWLTKDVKELFRKSLNSVCDEHEGETVIYLLIERMRETFSDLIDKGIIKQGQISNKNSEMAAETQSDSSPDDDYDDYQYAKEAYKQYLNKPNNEKKSLKINELQIDTSNVSCPQIFSGESVFDRKSEFVGHIAAVHSVAQAKLVLETLKANRKIAAATHNIYAFRIVSSGSELKSVNSDCEDDGEFGAGQRLLHLLNIINAENVMVVVTRWYGGIHLGGDRFKHINNCARVLLQQRGYTKDKPDAKQAKESSKKSKRK